eukprot:9598583-Alexandrium_andersonii.AAC.1
MCIRDSPRRAPSLRASPDGPGGRVEILLARFPELRHLEASDAQLRERKGIAALQLVADVA